MSHLQLFCCRFPCEEVAAFKLKAADEFDSNVWTAVGVHTFILNPVETVFPIMTDLVWFNLELQSVFV